MDAVLNLRDRCVVLQLSGAVSAAEAAALRRALTEAAREHPDGFVCDLSSVTDLDPACLAAVAAAVPPGPGPVLWLAAAPEHVARLLCDADLGDAVAVAATVEDAVHEAAQHPLLRESMSTAPSRFSVRQARAFTAEVCRRWDVGGRSHAAVQVASELVANAVAHAATPFELSLEYGQGRLRIAVRDGGPGLPPAWWDWGVHRFRGHGALREHGRGLHIVRALAAEVGAGRDPDGETRVWAVLDAPGRGDGPAGDVPAQVTETMLVRMRSRSSRPAAPPRTRPRLLATTTLQLTWRRDRPAWVVLTLVSVPAHPVLPSGEWALPRAALHIGLRDRAEHAGVVVQPAGVAGAVELEVPVGSGTRGLRVPARRLEGFLSRVDGVEGEAPRRPG